MWKLTVKTEIKSKNYVSHNFKFLFCNCDFLSYNFHFGHNYDLQKYAFPPHLSEMGFRSKDLKLSKWKQILYLIFGWIIPSITADEHFSETLHHVPLHSHTHTHTHYYCRCDGNAGSEMLICVAWPPNSVIVSWKSYAESEVWIIWIIPFKAFAPRV